MNYFINHYCGSGVFVTFWNENAGEKYFAFASSTLFSAACGLTISRPCKINNEQLKINFVFAIKMDLSTYSEKIKMFVRIDF